MPCTRKTFCTMCSVVIGVLLYGATASGQDTNSKPQTATEAQATRAVTRITLAEAQSRAAAGPMARVAQLTTDAAKYHRQAAEADYYPKIGSTFANLHFNKFMGETIQLARRTAAVPLMNKDQTIVAFTVTQPLTPLFKVKQAVQLAKADERIAQAKAAKMVGEVSSKVENAYFSLLISQRQEVEAEQKVKMLQTRLQLASANDPPALTGATESQAAFLEASKELVTARSKVAELTQPLNQLIGLPPETELELVVPEPVDLEPISLPDATSQAMATNPEIVEAEQTVVKARAATKLGKLDYIPDVAVMGGYSYQTAIDLLPADFSFIGVVASFNIFDGGKRERTIKERETNLELAQMNLAAVKAKVSSGVQKTFLDVERTRRIRDLTRQLLVVYDAKPASFQEVSTVERSGRTKAESDMLQAELEYRLAYAQLKYAIGNQK